MVGYFDTIVLYQTNNSGFKSSNHSVAYINLLTTNGTTFNAPDRPPAAASGAKFAGLVATPEPATVILVFSALMVVTLRHRRRLAGQAAAEVVSAESIQARKKRRRRSRPAQFGWPTVGRSRFST